MFNFPFYWYEFWRKRKLIFFFLLVFSIASGIYLTQRLNIHEDIMHMLPQNDQSKDWMTFLEESGTMQNIVFAINVSDNEGSETFDSLTTEFINQLEQDDIKWISDIRFRNDDNEEEWYQYMLARIPLMIDDQGYNKLEQKISPSAVSDVMLANYERLQSLEGVALKRVISHDPLLLSGLIQEKLIALKGMNPFDIQDGYYMSPSHDAIWITGKISQEYTSGKNQLTALEKLKSIRSEWNKNHANHPIRYFSGILIGAENALRVKKDTQLTIFLAIAGILFVLLYYYRSIYIPFCFIFPAAFGMLFALSVTSLYKGEISGIAIGISAVVIGIAMDYAFHFFSHIRESGSVKETLKDVTNPLIVGCLTTIMAFAALWYTNSRLLQDFGFFAFWSLVGSIIAVLFILPVLIDTFKFSIPKIKESEPIIRKNVISNRFRLLIALTVLLFTAVMLYKAFDIEFDSNPDKLSYYPEWLKNEERYFQNLEPGKDKRAFLLSEKNNKHAEYLAYQLLDSLYHKGAVKSYMSSGWFSMPDEIQKEKILHWNNFWNSHRDSFLVYFDKEAKETGFSPHAFDSFKKMISGNYTIGNVKSNLQNHINMMPGQGSLHSFTIDITKKDELIYQLSKQNTLRIIDPSGWTKNLLDLVQSDFNYILLISSLIVFLALWLVYGRLELAIITFVPMAVSWIWIVGLCATFNLKFNFANIIMTTFIFGLGDDFAIFVTDALINKYKTGKNLLSVYKKGILLSAITSIIGTGVLIFAKHPAIHSIALISVIGLIVILLVSFTIQPFLFDILIFNRSEKKRSPYTLKGFLLSLFAFSYFLLGCAIAYSIQFLFRILPIPIKKKKLAFHYMLAYFCKSLIYVMANVTKQIEGRQNLDFNKPSIIIANHSSFLDILATLMLHPRIIMLTNDWVYNSPFFGANIRYADFVWVKEGYEESLEKVSRLVNDGYSVLIFPEGSRSSDGSIHRFHKGAFFLAEKLQLDITPILLHGFHFTMSKHDFLLKDGFLNMKILPRIKHDDPQYGNKYSERTKKIQRYFMVEHNKFAHEKEDTAYIYPRMLLAYIYKRPQLEWYFRIKWKLEKKNYEHYDRLVPKNAFVYDLGCGYGFLSYYLSYKSPERKITGIDYDEDKIEIADNIYDRNQNLNFIKSNIEEVSLNKADVIFLNDVLHYLTVNEQLKIFKKSIDSLNEQGKIIIRDGVSDLKGRHKGTRLTEFFSTNIGFNKSHNKLSFFSSDFIMNFASEHQLTCEIFDQSKLTSNILFVLSRK